MVVMAGVGVGVAVGVGVVVGAGVAVTVTVGVGVGVAVAVGDGVGVGVGVGVAPNGGQASPTEMSPYWGDALPSRTPSMGMGWAALSMRARLDRVKAKVPVGADERTSRV
jgi:hypothetical protein